MLGAIHSVISAIPAWFWPVFLFGSGSLPFLMFKARLETPKTRHEIIDWLRETRGTARYERLVGRALGWVNARLTPRNRQDTPPLERAGWPVKAIYFLVSLSPNRAHATKVGGSAFGWPIFDLSLRFAVAYPVVLLILTWAIGADSGVLGATGSDASFEALPPLEPGWRSVAVKGGLLTVAAFLTASIYASATGRGGYARVILQWLAIFSAVAAAGAVTSFSPPASSLPLAIAVAGVFSNTVASGFVVTFAISVAVAFALAGAGAIAYALVVAAPIAIAVVTAIRRGADGRIVYAILACGLFAPLLGAVALGADTEAPQPRALLLFLALLPLANGVFDYLSLGVTRWLIAKGVEMRSGWTIALGAVDLGAAVILFTGLGLTLVAATTLLNAAATWAGSSPLIDLQALLIDIGDEPGRYWWLYLTFFSTLLPTSLHFGLSLFCLVALAPQRLKRFLIALIEDEDHGDRRALWAPLLLSFIAVFALAVPVLLAVIAVATLVSVAPQAGGWYLFIFLRFAEALGAPVEADAIWI